MALKLLRQKPEPELSEFESASRDWRATERAFAALETEREQRKLAIQAAASGRMVEGESIGDMAPAAKARTTTALIAEATKRPSFAEQEFQRVGAERDEMRPKYFAARQQFELAKRKETNRIARTLRPELVSIVARIEIALASLSVALADEAELHKKLGMLAPNPSSAELPSCSIELSAFGRLDIHNSAGSAWARRMRGEKLL